MSSYHKHSPTLGHLGYLWYPISANFKCALLRHAGQTKITLKALYAYKVSYCALRGPQEPPSKTCQIHSLAQFQLCTFKGLLRAAEPLTRYFLSLTIYECACSLNGASYAKHLKTPIRCKSNCASPKAPSSSAASVRHSYAQYACYQATPRARSLCRFSSCSDMCTSCSTLS